MENTKIYQAIEGVRKLMIEGGYSSGSIKQFDSMVSKLIEFMKHAKIEAFNTEIAIKFMISSYDYDPNVPPRKCDLTRIGFLRKLSEYQLHGTAIPRMRGRKYAIPEGFRKATDNFLEYRRLVGIVEYNMSTIKLYLERFFTYLSSHNVNTVEEIEVCHTDGFLIFITQFGNHSKNHMMRTVRQFMEYCFQNGYHSENLSQYIPSVHCERSSNIPSAYSYDDIIKLLSFVDRSNPLGKRDYAILLLISRLGLRAGDVSNLQFDNIDWEKNKISLTQHKTGQTLVLPLLEDVGNAIIDYLKFGRPQCDCKNIFVRHKLPIIPMNGGIYTLVTKYINRAGLITSRKKHGPHALRHSLATRLLEENVPLPIISEILGHTNSNTTATYLSISIDKLRDCALEVI